MQPTQAPTADALKTWLRERLAEHVRLSPDQIDPDQPFTSYGLDSVRAMGVIVDIEDHWGVVLDASAMWDHPSISAMSELLADQLA